jgi:Pentapeptide repeats (8 copies)
MILHSPRTRPVPWSERKARTRHRWLLPFLAIDFAWEWLAFLLSNWSFLEVLEYLGSFSILIGVIFWFAESGDRIQQRHYQAWQVINTAQGKGGSGGRIEALQALNADHISLTGVDVSSAFLQGLRLPGARLMRSNLSSADLRNSDLHAADLTWADLHYANLRDSDLEYAAFAYADLHSADLRGIVWQHVAAVLGANIAGVRNPPDGFVAWALQHGAVQTPATP